jgi:hypothetical protein
MLAALCVREPRRRWLSLRLRPPSVKAEIVNAGSGKFLKITAETDKKGRLNWTQIRRAAGYESSRLLLPRNITPPADSRIKPFNGVELSRKLMSLAAVSLLKTVSINPRLVCISVYDPEAVMPDLPLLFIPLAADVRVYTNRPERYAMQKYTAMQEYGAVLTVTTDSGGISESLLVLAPDVKPRDCTGLKHLALSNGWIMTAVNPEESQAIQLKGIIHGYIPRVSHSLFSAMPEGCDIMQFLSGLYELSGVSEIGSKPPEFLKSGENTITLKDAAWKLAGLDIGMSV